jgi:hypothetical protein
LKKPPPSLSPRLHRAASYAAPLLLVLAAGCTVIPPLGPACRTSSRNGANEPPTHCFYFPESLALDPLGDVLYVANDNIDLSFGGATVVAVDLMRHERAVECFRRHGYTGDGDAECGHVSCADLGRATDRSVSIEEMESIEASLGKPPADYDRCYCQWDVDDPSVINCESVRFVMGDQGVKTGFFPSSMAVLAEDPPNWAALPADGSTTLHRGLYLSVRGDPSITFIDVTRPLPQNHDGTVRPSVHLDCGLNSQPDPPHMLGQPYVLKTCADANHVQQTTDDVLIDPDDPSQGTRPRFNVPSEPSGVFIDRGCVERGYKHDRGSFLADASQNPNGKPPCYLEQSPGNYLAGTYYQYLVSSHRETGQVSAYDLGRSAILPVPAVLQDVSNTLLSTADAAGRRGGFGIAPRVYGDLSQPWYMTSSVSGDIVTFRVATAAGPHIVPGLTLSISNQFSLQADNVRDIVFADGGNRAFAALFAPPALAILDTSTRGGSGLPINQVTNVVNLCLGPSRIALAEVPRADMGADVRMTRLYVTCYNSGQLAEVDGDSGEMLAAIPVGRGPLSIVLNFGQPQSGQGVDLCVDPYISDGEAATHGITCPPMGGPGDLRPYPPRSPGVTGQLGPRAYVSAYLDNAIAVLDLDPRSPSYRRIISRIGLPIPKQVQ